MTEEFSKPNFNLENIIDQKIFDKNRNFHGVKGLVFIGDKILTYRRDTKTKSFPLYIDLPGGGKEEGESPFDTFKRETKEEFGIEINPDDVKYAKQYMSAMDTTKESYFIVVNPLNMKESDVVFGDEGLEPVLITPDEYLKLNDAIKRQQDKVVDYLATFKE
ncbi:MAG: NUDIX domain-containing protein [Candidatus Pacebacteria bacterium]|nr:NUDIX domain-containing protein [Candidatus Paceibacterota bacterium]MCF7862780.1 NUDIX domain-containing protein [Candidatus Paceibacterota bacterium]